MNSSLPFSDVTIITTGLGIFFLLIAFYKSIFHKRRPRTHVPISNISTPLDDNQPVKLSNPFQQNTLDKSSAKTSSTSFYPSYPKADNATSVSAFKPFIPFKELDASQANIKNETDYEWE